MHGCFPSLTPVNAVIRINNSRLIHLVFLCRIILFVGGEAWLNWLIPNIYPCSLCSIVSSQEFRQSLKGKICFRPSDCVSMCDLTEKLKQAEYKLIRWWAEICLFTPTTPVMFSLLAHPLLFFFIFCKNVAVYYFRGLGMFVQKAYHNRTPSLCWW